MTDEICDNALDDDGDGLIDLNDSDCKCPLIEPVSLIPNPSFEQRGCCPQSHGELDCAETWIQASVPTTDYLHLCGWAGWENLPPPLPFPDGDGCMGFRNGRFNEEQSSPNWKEYAGACLLAPLITDMVYRFEFFIGFTEEQNSPSTEIVFFGTTDCQYLPFGGVDEDFGCPANDPLWERLGAVRVSGANEWIQAAIQVRPAKDIRAIAIGPSCRELQAKAPIYYFFDNLILAEKSAFDFGVSSDGHPCSEDYALSIPYFDSLDYQWYKDGIALLGENKSVLKGNLGVGNYEVRITGEEGCRLSKVFKRQIPSVSALAERKICPGDVYYFNEKALSEAGVYWDTLKNQFNCDSIVQLILKIETDQVDTINAKIFPGEVFLIGLQTYGEPGQYAASIPSSNGCDSLIWLELDHYQVYIPNAFSPNFDGQNDRFTIMSGSDLVNIHSLQIYDRWGNLLFAAKNLPPNDGSLGWDGRRNGREAPKGVYLYRAILDMADGISRQVSGATTLIR